MFWLKKKKNLYLLSAFRIFFFKQIVCIANALFVRKKINIQKLAQSCEDANLEANRLYKCINIIVLEVAKN